MTPDPAVSSLGMGYFCGAGDDLWTMSDARLIELAGRELAAIGLVGKPRIRDAVVIRVPKAYPVYNAAYKTGLAIVREFLSDIPNLQLIGRNGQHRYNNQDHSMLGGVLAARNIAGARFNLWDLNTDQDFKEEGASLSDEEVFRLHASQPVVPAEGSRQSVGVIAEWVYTNFQMDYPPPGGAVPPSGRPGLQPLCSQCEVDFCHFFVTLCTVYR